MFVFIVLTTTKKQTMWQLLNFVVDEAKLDIYISRKKQN